MTARALCITADDYGMHGVVNQAIEQLAASGDITAVAVMVHEGAVLDTIDRLQSTGVAIGLHVVLTQERPVWSRLIGSALAPRGRLLASPYALTRALFGRPWLRQLLMEEIDAQLDRYASMGLPLSFVNSHEHVHEVPALWQMVAPLVERRGAVAVRSAHLQPLTPTRQGALALLSRASWRLHASRTPVQILSPLGAGQAGRMRLRHIEALIDRGLRWHAADDVLPELIVHPAVDDAPLHARYGDAAGHRRAEYDLLRARRLRDLWKRRDIVLAAPEIVSFQPLTNLESISPARPHARAMGVSGSGA